MHAGKRSINLRTQPYGMTKHKLNRSKTIRSKKYIENISCFFDVKNLCNFFSLQWQLVNFLDRAIGL